MDLDYLENRPAGLPSDECFLSIPKASMLYRSTETALPWVPTSNGEAARAMIPLLDLMEVWDRAPIDDDFITWTVANGYGSMTKGRRAASLPSVPWTWAAVLKRADSTATLSVTPQGETHPGERQRNGMSGAFTHPSG